MNSDKKSEQFGIIGLVDRISRWFGGGGTLPIFALALVCLAIYANSLSNGFVFDDYAVIVENKHIADLKGSLPAFLSNDYFRIAGGEDSYRPLATLSYFLIHSFAGLNPFYYHLTSVLLHVLNVMLVFFLARSILDSRFGALGVGLLFACHPALTEAVDCIAFNEDLLAAFFFLLALNIYVARVGREFALGWYALSLLLYFCGLLSKEMAISLPAIIYAYDLAFNADGEQRLTARYAAQIILQRWRVYSGYGLVGSFYLILRFIVITKAGDGEQVLYGTFFERLIYLPQHLFSFVKLAIFPHELKVAYVFDYPSNFLDIGNLAGLSVTSGLVVLSFFLFRHHKFVFFGIWWFLISLFPVYNLVQIFSPFAERYLYIPVIGFCLTVTITLSSLFLGSLRKRNKAGIATLLATLLVAGAYTPATVARNRDWKDGLTLWTKSVKQTPDSGVARGSLGRGYLEQGMLEKAIAEFKAAVQLMPDHFKAFYNLGVIYDRKNDVEQALFHYKAAIRINPGFADAHFNLANLYQKNGFTGAAVEHYRTVIKLTPEDIEARNNLGVAYARQGKLDQAIAVWEGALKIDPANISAQQNIRKARMLLQAPQKRPD
jgi:tetratricopeptide (TPR) repeat protein